MAAFEAPGVEKIGDWAFVDCAGLTAFALPAGVAKIGRHAFAGCENLAAFDVAAENAAFRAIDGVLYGDGGKTLICYPPGKPGTTFRVPDGVEAIGGEAFAELQSLAEVVLPASVAEIADDAFFEGAALTLVAPRGSRAEEYAEEYGFDFRPAE